MVVDIFIEIGGFPEVPHFALTNEKISYVPFECFQYLAICVEQNLISLQTGLGIGEPIFVLLYMYF